MSNTEELQHIVERMDRAAQLVDQAAAKLALDLEEARLLAAEDRIQISRLIILVQRLTQQSESTLSGTQRLEATTKHVAEDLAASIVRADEAPTETPGASADAALRSAGETAAQIASHEAGPPERKFS